MWLMSCNEIADSCFYVQVYLELQLRFICSLLLVMCELLEKPPMLNDK
jgi:hypothetical protein